MYQIVGQIIPRRGKPIPIKRAPYGYTRTMLTNGERECARRRRQIAEGRLRPQNGLEVSHVD